MRWELSWALHTSAERPGHDTVGVAGMVSPHVGVWVRVLYLSVTLFCSFCLHCAKGHAADCRFVPFLFFSSSPSAQQHGWSLAQASFVEAVSS